MISKSHTVKFYLKIAQDQPFQVPQKEGERRQEAQLEEAQLPLQVAQAQVQRIEDAYVYLKSSQISCVFLNNSRNC